MSAPHTPATLLLTREQPDIIDRLDRRRGLHRIRAGAYVRVAEWEGLAPWERYRLRVDAVARTWTAPAFCLESAAVLLGTLPLFGEPREIHLLSPDGRSWREGDVVVHGSKDARTLVRAKGSGVTCLEDTALDLCRVLPPAFALAVADAALRALAPSGTLLRLGDRGRAQENRRGLRQLDWVQHRAVAVAESPGESVSRAVIEWLGHEDPELQHTFRYEGAHDRSDFYWPRMRCIGESDGYGKYDADDPIAMKAHFVREKQREDRLRRHEDGFIRWDWGDSIAWQRLGSKLRDGGLVPIRPPASAMLATLASNPRSLPRTTGVSARPRATAWVSA